MNHLVIAPDDDEHGHEPGRHRRPTSSARRTDARCESASRRLEAEEVHEVGRQQHEAARVDGATMPRRNDRPRFTTPRHQCSAMRAAARLVDRAGPVDDLAVGVDEQRHRVGDDPELVGEVEAGSRSSS